MLPAPQYAHSAVRSMLRTALNDCGLLNAILSWRSPPYDSWSIHLGSPLDNDLHACATPTTLLTLLLAAQMPNSGPT